MTEHVDVVVTRPLPHPGTASLERAGITCWVPQQDAGSEWMRRVAHARGLLCQITDRIDDQVIDAGERLKIIANIGVGYDNIDVDHASRAGIVVTNTPGVLRDATADLTWALILATTRRLIEGDALVRSGRWAGWEMTQLLGTGLAGKVLGIFGMGEIGAAVARRATAFGLRTVYHNRRPRPGGNDCDDAEYVDLSTLLQMSDVLTLHAPLTTETHHVIDASALRAMKREAILINTGRGPLVDESALVAALNTGQIAGAGLDVYEHEPAVHPGLRASPKVVLLPHLGSATTQTRAAMVQLACDNIVGQLRTGTPVTPVNDVQDLTKG